ncbi:hypothetical protein AB0383_20630 [Amycolatopsis sp. NPDC051373]|uniref:hypothetical protein n=1 Tax=Amycolatopsis sp. NPDC051373 TaxID=3155801 RepID=UPI00344BA3B5
MYHRVDEIEELPADRFLSFMRRLPVYGGAVALAVREAPQASVSEPPEPAGAHWNDIADVMRTDPLFMGQGTYVTVPAE